MALSKEQIATVENVLRKSLRNKFKSYNPEPSAMPFHTRLLGKDRMALFSFIHSLNTNFGTSIYEPVAVALSTPKYASASSQQTSGTQISSEARKVIQDIMDGLIISSKTPDKLNEIESIREVCRKGEMKSVKPTKIDIKLIGKDNTIYMFDLKTAKPNMGGFKEFKRTLLEWVAATLAIDPTVEVNSFIAIPYNPDEPKPYSRWTMAGIIDVKNELKVGYELWDFIGGDGTYPDLLDIFERIGVELRPEIDEYFSKYNKYKS